MTVARQTAGKMMIEVNRAASPLFFEVYIEKLNGNSISARVELDDLVDLRYCIDRIIEKALPK